MKAMINTKRTHRVLTTVFMLTIAFTMSQAQGLLIERASKLIHSLVQSDIEQSTFVLADFSENENRNGDSFRIESFKNLFNHKDLYTEYTPAIVKSFTFENVDIVYEDELETEAWMTETFNTEIEAPTGIEAWMTEPFSNDFEESVNTENWMMDPFYTEIEEKVSVENWMIQPLNTSFEEQIQTEDWMLEPFSNSTMEPELAVEDWMTSPLLEEEIDVENWMLQLMN